MKHTTKQFGEDIIAALSMEAEDLGLSLTTDVEAAALYAADRADALSLTIEEPGYYLALIAERDNVAMFAAGLTVGQADAMDARFLAAARGSLALAARGIRLLAGLPG